MNLEQIYIEIAMLEADIASCDETIKELRSYGASWALDCREMRISESNRMHASSKVYELKEQIKQMAKVSADSQKSEYEQQFEAFIGRC
jgi:hypothetical protein